MNVRHLALAAIGSLAVSGLAVGRLAAQPAPTVTPPPIPNSAPGTPAPVATARARATAAPRRGAPSPSPSPSETPAPLQFSSLDGVWEVEAQPLDGSGRTVYSHFTLTQKGEDLTGVWTRNNRKLPVTGTFDGRLFTLTAKDGAATLTMSGYAENYSDMVGLLRTGDPKDQGTPFTAQHRKKERIGA